MEAGPGLYTWMLVREIMHSITTIPLVFLSSGVFISFYATKSLHHSALEFQTDCFQQGFS